MRWLLFVSALAACGPGTRFGKIVTEVTVSPSDPRLLLVRSCDLIATSKADKHQVAVDNCKRYGVRRSPIVPVPLAEARVVARENRIVTGFIERQGGGAVITTCRIEHDRTKWLLADCVDTEIATAPLDAAEPAPPTPPDTAPQVSPPSPETVPAPPEVTP